MKIPFFFSALLLLLGGCAGMRVEVRGFDPVTTAHIMRVFEMQAKKSCTEGIVAERRTASVRVTSWNPNEYFPSRNPPATVTADATGEVRCK